MRYIIQVVHSYVCDNRGNKGKPFKFTDTKDKATKFELQELAFYVRSILEVYSDNVNARVYIIPVVD